MTLGEYPPIDPTEIPAVEPISIEIDIPVEAVAYFDFVGPEGKLEGVAIKGEPEPGTRYLLVRQVL